MINSPIPNIQKGIIFPSRNCHFLIGVTFICSIVPNSFSLTKFNAVTYAPINVTKITRIPGTIKFRLLKASQAAQKLDVEMTKIKKTIDKLEEKHELKKVKNPLEEKEYKLNSVRKE